MLDLGDDVAGGLAGMEASGPLIRDWVDAFNQRREEIHQVTVRASQTLRQQAQVVCHHVRCSSARRMFALTSDSR